MKSRTHSLTWREDGTPYSQLYCDGFFADGDGRAETRFVFLENNDLPARFGVRHVIGELGFGTGLSFLETWAAWDRQAETGCRLAFHSLEAHPMSRDDLQRAHATWTDLAPYSARLRANWEALSAGPVELAPGLMLRIVFADVDEALGQFPRDIDTWFLDGFNPATNPRMWSPEVMTALTAHSAPGARFASYTAAGWVRRNLEQAGFEVERRKGFGRKRHMIAGRLLPDGERGPCT